ncbi:general secretion pathway protein A [Paucibacter oligotrophus]|uniref:General secretion pathway protein A n=1 Tax=Roseateles oligotrophus TaxID=1769250 RepID=A0A840LIP3_9BURK|nr:ExeA family protein [Roseateles oligotrophus]MBB4845849.1 general secretion pathway protein A [Roseateles oligotrophus]
MYAKFFGLKQAPFSIAPDPHYLFMSERHREALAHLLYGLRGGGGFVLLTGEIGAGKTTVCRCFLQQIPKHCNVAYIFNPKLSVPELLQTVCEEFHIPMPPLPAIGTGLKGEPALKPFVDAINEFLLRTHAVGQNNVLIIDEAQNLSAEVLEQLRLLTNLETSERKLLQIVLIGQPELRQMLAAPELEQLAQRVIARFHLQALSEAETAQYISHRLGVAGLERSLPFERGVLRRIHQLSRGVPRRINLLCDRALLGAYAQGRSRVDRKTLQRAAAEVFEGRPAPGGRPWVWAGGGLAGLALATALAWSLAKQPVVGRPAVAPAAVAAASSASALAAAAASAASAASSPAPALAAAAASSVTPALIQAGLREEAQAWRELAALWQLQAVAAVAQPCQALAQTEQVLCYQGSGGSLALLRLLDRPTLLSLQDEAGQPYQLLLLGLGAQTALVRSSAGGPAQTLSLLELGQQWRGDYATLWRQPPGYAGHITPGPMLDWLRAQLAKARGEPMSAATTPPAQKYDAATRAKVAAFQRSQGLERDGLAGPVTLMQLNRVAGVAEPRLQALP